MIQDKYDICQFNFKKLDLVFEIMTRKWLTIDDCYKNLYVEINYASNFRKRKIQESNENWIFSSSKNYEFDIQERQDMYFFY